MTIEELIDKHYDELFDELIDICEDSFTDLAIEVKVAVDGKTIRRSWKDREKMLEEENRKQSYQLREAHGKGGVTI